MNKKKNYKTTNKNLVRRKYLSFNALQTTARDYGIKNRKQYEKWVRKERPKSVPLYPWRVYEEWTTWGEFLGTDNIFIPFHKYRELRKKTWKTYWDAARWVQQQNFKTSKEFLQAYEEGKIPHDIPKCPPQVYHEKYKGGWTGWKNFLGTTIQRKVNTMQQQIKLFAISGVPGHPHNYFRIINAPEGIDHLKEQLDNPAYRIFEYNEENQKELGPIISQFASLQGSNIYLSNNMNNLFFEIQSVFLHRKDIEQQILNELK
jgi:hypothetical protein